MEVLEAQKLSRIVNIRKSYQKHDFLEIGKKTETRLKVLELAKLTIHAYGFSTVA